MADGFFRVCGKGKTPCLDGVLHNIVQAWFVDGNLATLKLFDLGLINVHTQNVMTNIRQTCTGHEPDITGSKNRNFHPLNPNTKKI